MVTVIILALVISVISWSVLWYVNDEYVNSQAIANAGMFLPAALVLSSFLLLSSFGGLILSPLAIVQLMIHLLFLLFFTLRVRVFKSLKFSVLYILYGYFFVEALVLLSCLVLRFYPPVLIPVLLYFQEISSRFVPGNLILPGENLVSVTNQILLALLSYIPVSIIRFAIARHQRRILEKKVAMLSDEVQELRKRLPSSDM
jgi:hypothetical protein